MEIHLHELVKIILNLKDSRWKIVVGSDSQSEFSVQDVFLGNTTNWIIQHHNTEEMESHKELILRSSIKKTKIRIFLIVQFILLFIMDRK